MNIQGVEIWKKKEHKNITNGLMYNVVFDKFLIFN